MRDLRTRWKKLEKEKIQMEKRQRILKRLNKKGQKRKNTINLRDSRERKSTPNPSLNKNRRNKLSVLRKFGSKAKMLKVFPWNRSK